MASSGSSNKSEEPAGDASPLAKRMRQYQTKTLAETAPPGGRNKTEGAARVASASPERQNPQQTPQSRERVASASPVRQNPQQQTPQSRERVASASPVRQNPQQQTPQSRERAASASPVRRNLQQQETAQPQRGAPRGPPSDTNTLTDALATTDFEGRRMAPLHLGAARTGPATPRPRPRPEASRPASRPVTGSNFPPKVDNKPGSSSGAARAYPETPFVAMVRFDPISAPRTQRPTASDESDSRREIIQDSWLGMLYQRERRENDAAALNLTSRSKPGGSRQYKAVAASGQEFCPKASGHQVPLPGHSEPQRERSPEGEMGIGIETEFLLAARQPLDRRTKLNEFANVVARSHNANVALEHPRMTNDVEKPGARDQFDHWALVVDDSMSTGRSPWGIEMTSPLLVASPGSQWRRHVEATWMYLQKAYEITKNENCATHIHISVKGGYSLQEIKRVAQASIYFEPAFDALVPPHRRVDDRWAQSSWLDSPKLARAGRSRAQSATLIGQVPDIFSLGSLLQPLTKRCYTFSFDSILKYYTIEFRKPPASTSVEEVLGWAELAMNFVQASLKNGYPHLLEKVPPTVGGLRWFLSQSQVATMNEPDRLRCIFGGKHKDAFEQGKFDHVVSKGEVVYRGYVLSEETAEVRSVINRDTARIQRLIQNSTEPYW